MKQLVLAAVREAGTFRAGVLEAIRHAQGRGGTVLFGVEPSEARADYGWITLAPGPGLSPGIRPVVSFVEKPDIAAASDLLRNGAIWNTMVLDAKAHDLLDLCRAHLPELTAMFDHALTLSRTERHAFISDQYPGLAARDFSRDVLTPSRTVMAYTWPATMGWSDLGTPERLDQWLQPSAPAAALDGRVGALGVAAPAV